MDCQQMMIFTILTVGLTVFFGAIYVKRAQELARERETMRHTEAALTTSPPDPSVSPPIQATLEVTEDLTVSSVETAATPVKRRSRVHVSITLPKVNVTNAFSSATRRCSLSKLVHVPTLRNQSKERSKSARQPVHSPIIEVSEDDLQKGAVTDVVTVAEEKTNVSRRGEDDTAVLESTLTSTTTTTTTTTSSRGPVPVKPTVRSHPEVQVTTMQSASSSSYSSPSTSPPPSSPSLSPSSSSSSAALPSRNPTPWPSPDSSPLTPSRDLQSAAQTPRQTRKLDTSPADTVKATDLKQPRRKHFRRVMRNGAGEPLRHPDGELQRMARPACAENSLSGVVFKQGYENPFKLLIRSGSKDRAQDAQPSTVPPTSTRMGSSDTPTAPRPTVATVTPKVSAPNAGGVEALPKDSGLRAAFRLSFSFAAIKSSSSVDVSRDTVGPYGGVPMSTTSTDHASYTAASASEGESPNWPPSPDDSSDSNASESTSIFSLQSLSTKASSVFSGRGSSSSLKSESGLVTVAPRPTESTSTSTGDGADANAAASCPSDAGMGCTNTADRGLQLVTADVDPLGVVPS